MNTTLQNRLKAVEAYLDKTKSLRATAKRFHISHLTLWRWVKWYKQGGRENLDRESIFRPWNRLELNLEKRVVLMKERNPSLTVAQAKKHLSKKGLKISKNGIWSIWKRYGLVGLSKEISSADLVSLFFKNTEVISPRLMKAQELLESFGKIPFSEYYRKANRLRRQLEAEKLFYSAVRVGVTEAITLSWMAKPEKQLLLTKQLKTRIPKRGDPYIRYLLLIGEGIAYAQTLNISQALNCARMCRHVLKHLNNVPSLWRELANLYNHIGRYKESLRIIEKILAGSFGTFEKSEREMFYADLSILHASSGHYRECLRLLNKMDKTKIAFRALILMLRAQCMLGQAKIYEAQDLARRALQQSKKDEIYELLHVASLIFAGAAAAMGEKERAKSLVSRLNAVFRKSRMEKDMFVREILSSSQYKKIKMRKYRPGILFHSVCQLVFLLAEANATLKLRDYRKAYNYAAGHSLLGLFHRFLLFFPESVAKILKKGKAPGLSKPYLQLPIYKKDVPVYRIEFLGPIRVYIRNRLGNSLALKDRAFLIFLALARKKAIPLSEIYKRFWPDSKIPARNLSHLLVRLRKVLRLTTQYLNIRGDFLFCDCHFITDYDEYENYVAQAKALERIGKWAMAEKEYCAAFRLFREKPFTGMYDSFSDDKRLEIVFKFEENARHFIEELTEKRGRLYKDLPSYVKKTLRKVVAIVPDLRGCLYEHFQI
jgi:transposase